MGGFFQGGTAPVGGAPSEGTALTPSARCSGPLHSQTPPSPWPSVQAEPAPVFQKPFTNILQKTH